MKHPTFLTLGEASKITGVSKSTISRALKNGVVTYESIGKDGYKIDPAALNRVFPVKHLEQLQGVPVKHFATPNETPEVDHKKELLEYKLQVMEEKIEDLKKEKEKWEQQSNFWRLQSQLKLNPGQSDEQRNELIKKVQIDTINRYKEHLNRTVEPR